MAVELGEAYVRIVPVAKGISGKIQSAIGSGDKVGANYGKGLGAGIMGAIGKLAIGAGIASVISKSISEGANLQQSLGGIETMFKENANTVIKNAETAYIRAGVSQNQYMENVTSFSASLINSLGGDTVRAAKLADIAMVDMSDNANKFGTNIGDIQHAYQGFAKQNYTIEYQMSVA